jgi:transmembrane sensor
MLMSDGKIPDSDDARRTQTASNWLITLGESHVPETVVLEWIEWCESDPRNLRAFEQMQSLWRATTRHLPDARQLAGLRRSEVPLSVERRRPRMLTGFTRLAIAASVATLCVVAWVAGGSSGIRSTLNGTEHTARIDSVQTPVATNQQAVLPDGSHVDMGARSILDVDFTGSQRLLKLRHGQAFFRVKHDATHPFVVDAGDIRVIAVGTAFDVRQSGAEVSVTVQEGTVEVQKDGSAMAPVRATAGYQLVFDTATGSMRRSIVDPEMALAWRDGRLEFTGDTLDAVIESVNRYAQRPIVIADPALGKLTFTGTVFVDSIDASLDAMQQVFPLQVRRTGHEIILVKRP